METTTALSVLNLCPSTKEQAQVFADQVINEVIDGNANPLSVHIQITVIEKTLEKIKEGIEIQALGEAEKHGPKAFDHMRCRVEIKEMGTKWDFTGCTDPVWNRLRDNSVRLKEAMKEREMLLKSIHRTTHVVDEETGEIIELRPALKTSTTGLAITLK